MSIKTDGILFIFSSPSGAGKTTLVKLVEKKENFLKRKLKEWNFPKKIQKNEKKTKNEKMKRSRNIFGILGLFI